MSDELESTETLFMRRGMDVKHGEKLELEDQLKTAREISYFSVPPTGGERVRISLPIGTPISRIEILERGKSNFIREELAADKLQAALWLGVENMEEGLPPVVFIGTGDLVWPVPEE
jgi:hypothetical protein